MFSLESQGRGVLWTVSYGDSAPWPGSADGLGQSRIYRGGIQTPPNSWRPSVAERGNPGESDHIDFADSEDPLGYALKSFELGSSGGFDVCHRLGADDALVEVQWTRDLQHWPSESMERTVSVTTGAERYDVWRRVGDVPSGRCFYRVKVVIIGR